MVKIIFEKKNKNNKKKKKMQLNWNKIKNNENTTLKWKNLNLYKNIEISTVILLFFTTFIINVGGKNVVWKKMNDNY